VATKDMLAIALTFAMTFATLATPHAKAKHARLTSVESRVEGKLATEDPRAVLRADLERELANIDWKQEGVKAPFELSAVLTAAESASGKKSATASCVVQVVLREPSGALLGTVSGRASGEDAKGGRKALELGVLEAAAKTASSAIPEAIRQSRKAR
jgi:hypothetical protein